MTSDDALLAAARTAAKNAYAPFSRFSVGAAVLAGGKIYAGCNVENSSYGLTMCAERVAIFTAISAGEVRIQALALSCADGSDGTRSPDLMPCGACRQVLAEFADREAKVIVDSAGVFTLGELLPRPFELYKPPGRGDP